MKINFDFSYLNDPADYIPADFEIESEIIPRKGEYITYEWKDGGGNCNFFIEDVHYCYMETEFNHIVIYLKYTP